MIDVMHYSTAADMRARYRAIRSIFWKPSLRKTGSAPPKPAPPEPVAVELPAGFAYMLRNPRSRFEAIVVAICHEFHITRRDLFGRSRRAEVVAPRAIAFALARHLTPKSMPQIGRDAGGFDHTTILHAVRKLAEALDAVKDGIPEDATPAEWVKAMRERMVV